MTHNVAEPHFPHNRASHKDGQRLTTQRDILQIRSMSYDKAKKKTKKNNQKTPYDQA